MEKWLEKRARSLAECDYIFEKIFMAADDS